MAQGEKRTWQPLTTTFFGQDITIPAGTQYAEVSKPDADHTRVIFMQNGSYHDLTVDDKILHEPSNYKFWIEERTSIALLGTTGEKVGSREFAMSVFGDSAAKDIAEPGFLNARKGKEDGVYMIVELTNRFKVYRLEEVR